MARFLIVVPPLIGHINPAVGVAATLSSHGHAVAWAGTGDVIRPLVGEDSTVYHCAGPPPGAAGQRPPVLRGFAELKFLWEGILIPLAHAMAPGVRAAVRDFGPDVLVVDQQAFAGAVVARQFDLPWATLATTSSELVDPLGAMPKIQSWREARMQELLAAEGLPDTDADLRFSPDLVLAFTTGELAGPVGNLDAPCRFVGPSLAGRPAGTFPWHLVDNDRPSILITLGTANTGAGNRFLHECVQALTAMDVQAIIVDPGSELTAVPAHILALPQIPQLEVLAHTDAVVCHAGHNTVCEALSYGIPLVVAPIRDDQPVIAGQVVEVGAGIRVRFRRARAHQLREAIHTVLHDPGFRNAARRIQKSFGTAGGSAAAAGHLEQLAANR